MNTQAGSNSTEVLLGGERRTRVCGVLLQLLKLTMYRAISAKKAWGGKEALLHLSKHDL